MTSKIGLTGLYQPPCTRDDFTSVYMISDEDTSSLFIFVLFPGCYHDIYEIAYLTEYTKIFLVPISLNPVYLSDIYRLVNDLSPIKEMVKVIHPDHFPSTGLNTLFLNSLVRGDTKTSYVYSNHGFIAFDWNNENPINGKHDIYCTFGDKRILLTSQYVDVDRIEELFEKDLVDYVYVPWQNPAYTTENFTNFVTIMSYLSDKPYGCKIIPYGFGNQEAINYCKELFPDNMPVTVRHLFENERPQEEEICMTWSETYGEPHRPEPPKQHCPLMPHHHHHPPMPVKKVGWIPGPPPPLGDPFWQGPSFPKPPHPHPHPHPCPCPIPPSNTVDNDYKNPTAFEFAISEMLAACPGLETWIQNCDIGCEECPCKEYVQTPPEDVPTEENPSDKTDPSTSVDGEETNSNEPNGSESTEGEVIKPGADSSDAPTGGSETENAPTDSESQTTTDETNTNESEPTEEVQPDSTEESTETVQTATTMME